MTLPLVIVYLHQVRGLGLGDAGIALAAVGAGGIAGTLVAGVLADRSGPGWTAVGGLLLAGVGTAGYLAVHGTGSAIAASAAQGAGFAATWVGVFPLLVRAVEPERRGDVLGANYAVTNLGLGIGSTVAGIVLSVDRGAFTPALRRRRRDLSDLRRRPGVARRGARRAQRLRRPWAGGIARFCAIGRCSSRPA